MSNTINKDSNLCEILVNTTENIGMGNISEEQLITDCENSSETSALGRGVETEIFVNTISEGLIDDDGNDLFGKLSRICRCCLIEYNDLKSIFDEENCIISMLLFLTPVQIAPNDGLPPKICEGCLEHLTKAVHFKQQIENAEMSLRHFIAVGHTGGMELQILDFETLAKTMSDNVTIQMEKVDENDQIYDMSSEEDDNQAVEYLFVENTENCESVIISSNTEEELKEKSDENDDCIQQEGSTKTEIVEQMNNSHENSEEGHIEKEILLKQDTSEKPRRRSTRNIKSKFSLINKENDSQKSVSENEYNLRCHQRKTSNSEHSKDSLRCEECDKVFTNESDLYIHGSIHVTNGNFVCRKCEKEFPDCVKLKRHVRIHFEDKPFKCQVCNRGFPEMGALTRHFRQHTGVVREKKHACSLCGKRYYDSHSLSVHFRTHTGEKPWVCIKCGKAFIDSRLLNSHLKIHSDEKKYACDRCGRRFTHHSTLVSHIRTHTGEKPYLCYICKKSFIQSSNLSLHMRVHTGAKPYKCELCDRAFASSSTLTLHMRTHTGEKPYQCPQCQKRFARHNLSNHMRTHTGEKPFNCPKCSRKFTTSSQLNLHIRTHTGEKSYICTICDKTCASSSYLKRHQRMHVHKFNCNNSEESKDIDNAASSISSNITEHVYIIDGERIMNNQQEELHSDAVYNESKILVNNLLAAVVNSSNLETNSTEIPIVNVDETS